MRADQAPPARHAYAPQARLQLLQATTMSCEIA
jgi:hypothetical protein